MAHNLKLPKMSNPGIRQSIIPNILRMTFQQVVARL